MAIGAQNLNTNNINNTIGNWAISLRDLFSQAPVLQSVLSGIGLTALQAAPYNFSTADATALLNCINDIVALGNVYYGTSYVAFGATVNSGVVTTNSASHFGYNFDINIGSKAAGLGF
jgi:hypothetical protein